MADSFYTLPGVPSDVLTSDVVGERRVKVSVEGDLGGGSSQRDLTFQRDKVDATGSTVEIANQIQQPLQDGGSVTVGNQPADYPDSGTHDRLDDVTGLCTDGETKAARIISCDTVTTQDVTRLQDNGTKFFLNDEFGADMNINGGGAIFTLKPDEGTVLEIDAIRFSFVDQVTTIVATGHPRVDYNGLGALPALANGLQYRRVQNEQTIQTLSVRRLYDLMRVPGSTLEVHAGGMSGDVVLFVLTAKFARPLVLKSSLNDRLEYLVQDDLTGLLELNISTSSGQYQEV